MCNREYPVTPFQQIRNLSPAKIDRLIERQYAVLFTVRLHNVRLRNRYFPVPYIPVAKCAYCRGIKNDNGRILTADELQITVTDIDWKIIVAEYTFSAEIIQGYYAGYGKLPSPIIDCNIEFFKKKTELKGLPDQELYYAKNKELLNSIYGMTVQNPAKATILFDNGLYTEDPSMTEEELLTASRRRAFQCYQWGCWTTSHARAALEAGINICGDQLLYVDTDSCKVIGQRDFSRYNEQQKELSLTSGLYATDRKGCTHYGGVFEDDGTYKAFITQGAKKYAYQTEDDRIKVTVSGVGKKKGAAALTAAGGLDAFKPGFIFHACGKTRSIYNDAEYGLYAVGDQELYFTRNVVIEDTDYTLSRTIEYDSILNEAKAFLYKSMEIRKNNKTL